MASPRDDIKKRMTDARDRFFGAVQGPAAPKPNRVPQRAQQGVGPVRPAARVRQTAKAPAAPEFITAKTNPELSAQQARVINQARAMGYESQKESMIGGQNALDSGYQSGLNAMATTRQTGNTQRAVNRMQQEGLNDRQRNTFAQSLKERSLNRGDAVEDRDLKRTWDKRDAVRDYAAKIFETTGDANLASGLAAGDEFIDFNRGGGFTPSGAIDIKRVGGEAADPIYGRFDTRTGKAMDPQLEAWLTARNKRLNLDDEEEY